jgi:hypothetical protein
MPGEGLKSPYRRAKRLVTHRKDYIMQPTTNNNLLAEISALVIASLLILVAGFLLYVGKIDTGFATLLFGAALTLLGLKAALTAPNAAQQATLQGLLATQQQLQLNQQQVLQPLLGQVFSLQSAPVAAPQVAATPFNLMAPPNFTTSYNPPTGAMPASAMQTTMNMASMPKQ